MPLRGGGDGCVRNLERGRTSLTDTQLVREGLLGADAASRGVQERWPNAALATAAPGYLHAGMRGDRDGHTNPGLFLTPACSSP